MMDVLHSGRRPGQDEAAGAHSEAVRERKERASAHAHAVPGPRVRDDLGVLGHLAGEAEKVGEAEGLVLFLPVLVADEQIEEPPTRRWMDPVGQAIADGDIAEVDVAIIDPRARAGEVHAADQVLVDQITAIRSPPAASGGEHQTIPEYEVAIGAEDVRRDVAEFQPRAPEDSRHELDLVLPDRVAFAQPDVRAD